MKRFLNKMMQQLSLLGKTMLVPIAVMPAAGILGLLFGPNMLNVPAISNISNIVFSNVDYLFLLGAASAYSKSKDKTSVMVAAVVAYMIFKSNLELLNDTLNAGVFGGIIVGACIAWTYNKTYKVKVPAFLSFFAGEKCVITLSPVVALILSYIFSLLWIYPQAAMNQFGFWLGGAGAIGIFLFLFCNRALIPTGLHQVLNAYILFEMGEYTTSTGEVIRGEIPRFMAGDPNAGFFWTGFYIIMMFSIPAISYAIYKTAQDKKKQEVKGAMTAGALTSFMATVTEPIEFSFLFASPKLYIIHSFYSGLGGVVLYLLGARLGSFNGASIIDYVLSFSYGDKAWLVIPVGVVFFVLYYVTFKYIIIKDNVQTPGREVEIEIGDKVSEKEKNLKLSHGNFSYMAKQIIKNCGGYENIVTLNNCMTRLRLEVKDATILNDDNIKKTGAKGVIKLSNTSVQIIIGTDVVKAKDEMEMQLDELRKQADA
ncbi:TPA: PTS transporter subunit EIIC [Clostridioides difficile]